MMELQIARTPEEARELFINENYQTIKCEYILPGGSKRTTMAENYIDANRFFESCYMHVKMMERIDELIQKDKSWIKSYLKGNYKTAENRNHGNMQFSKIYARIKKEYQHVFPDQFIMGSIKKSLSEVSVLRTKPRAH